MVFATALDLPAGVPAAAMTKQLIAFERISVPALKDNVITIGFILSEDQVALFDAIGDASLFASLTSSSYVLRYILFTNSSPF